MKSDHGKVIDYSKKPLGTITRRYFSGPRQGKPCEWIVRCPKCEKRGSRSVFLPEKTARRGESKPYLSWTHRGHIVDVGFRFFSVDEHCTVTLTDDNADELLNTEEMAEFRKWEGE